VKDKKIRDNPSMVEMNKKIVGLEGILKISGFLEGIGILKKNSSDKLTQVEELKRQMDELANIPDRFNEIFLPYGWIAYESMNFDIMKQAVDIATNGKIDDAEQILVNYYNQENMHWLLLRFMGVPQFRPRYELLQKACQDYLSERYHACVPVVLMMIDGVVNDIGQKGFFAEGTDLSAWDTIVGHESGLGMLAKILTKSRTKMTTETILIPYRNGILHGRDIGYDNKVVAAKAWAALFAVRDWAAAQNNGQKKDEEKKPEGFFEQIKDFANSLKEMEERKKYFEGLGERISKWQARVICIENDKKFCCEEGTPEKEVITILEDWKEKKYGKIAQKVMRFGADVQIKKMAGRIRAELEAKPLQTYKILEIVDEVPAVSEVKVVVEYQGNTSMENEIMVFRMIYEGKDGDPTLRGEPGGSWKVVNQFF